MEDKKLKNINKYSTKSAFDFLEDIKTEFKKVTWTDRDELKVYTQVVVGATFIFGMAVYFSDLMIQTGISGINSAISLLIG